MAVWQLLMLSKKMVSSANNISREFGVIIYHFNKLFGFCIEIFILAFNQLTLVSLLSRHFQIFLVRIIYCKCDIALTK